MPAPRLTYRPATPDDEEQLAALDTSFTTDTVHRVTAGPTGFTIRPEPVHPPLTKHFPADDDEDEDDDDAPKHTVVALDGDRVCGFVAVDHEPWNARLTIRDIAVAPTHRGHGIAGELMTRAYAYGRQRGARHVWLEVTHLNAPAIRAYQRMGFTFCGLDTTLYTGTPSEGEIALFMSRSLPTAPDAPGPTSRP
ncbi:GNAT family N-acetyltransferase [Streptomyces pactum]|uniref:GNAT family N-acetyltransferase n=1 Tax=Streptomyces pactum TaxID=68249 RepID=B7TWN3_9ACTN|nr:GNAT family N-acetyltransferase [Streptomyces pactum]ACJ24884.1 nourseothricin acetyltransferase-like protein [Streptomyces pactum]MBH5336250.1 GNAT family N-acetyltransferase [Streptomyces pactum]